MNRITKEYLLEVILSWYSDPENVKKKFAHRNALKALESKTLGQLLFVACDIYGVSIHALSKGSGITTPRFGEFSRGQDLLDEEHIKLHKFLSQSFRL